MAAGNYTTTSHKPYEGEMYTDEQLGRTIHKTSACGISTVDMKGNEMADTREVFEIAFKLTQRQAWRTKDGTGYQNPEIQAKREGYLAGVAAAPTQEPAAWICIYDDGEVDYTPLRELAEAAPTAIPLYRSAAAAPGAVQEPVEYQVRTRPMWRDEAEGWTEWRKCSPESYADYVRVPVLHDWQHETRALYAAPGAVPAIRVTEAMLDAAERVDDLYRMGQRELWGRVFRAMLAAS